MGAHSGRCLPIEPPEEAISRLAQRLYWNMQRLDPDPESPEWEGLSERSQRFYRLLVEDLVEFDDFHNARPSSRPISSGMPHGSQLR